MKSLLKQFIKKKILINKPKKQNPLSNINDITDLRSPANPSLYLSSEKSYGLKTPATTTNRRKASFFEEKDKRIEQKEQEVQEFKRHMIEFYYGLKSTLLVENEVKEKLNDILYDDELSLKLRNFTLNHCFEMITKLIKFSLNITEKIKSVSVMDVLPKKESDLMIIIQSMEGEIIHLRKEVIYLDGMNQIINEKNLKIEGNDKTILSRCEETINSYKKDYLKLLRVLKDKEADMAVLKKTIDEKEDNIAALHDKLLSVVVLEHKLKEIERKYKHDFDKSIESHRLKLKEVSDTRKFSPNFFHRINDYENSQKKLENDLLLKNLENKKIWNKKKQEIEERQKINLKLTNSLNSERNEIEKLKELLSTKNKDIYHLSIKSKMLEEKLSWSLIKKENESSKGFRETILTSQKNECQRHRFRKNHSQSSEKKDINRLFLTLNS